MRALLYRHVLRKVYDNRFKRYGGSPEGCFWTSRKKQTARFRIILTQLKSIVAEEKVSVADIGCGYGAMADYILVENSGILDSYIGYDISKVLIKQCINRIGSPKVRFLLGEYPRQNVEFSLMSGTYNLAVTENIAHWETYVFRCLGACWKKTNRAMIFNLQVTKRAKPYISKGNIYYASCQKIVDRCNFFFGPTETIKDPALPLDTTFVVKKEMSRSI